MVEKGYFRNRSHVVESAVKKLVEESKKEIKNAYQKD